jgi:hypothetical protein
VSEILLADSDAGISPHGSIAVPYRLSARPITRRKWRWFYIYGWRCVVAWPGDCSSNNSPCGKAAYDSCRYIPAARTHWSAGSGKSQQENHDSKLLHFGPRTRTMLKKPRLLIGMWVAGASVCPGRQTDPTQQDRNGNWCLGG